MNHFLLRITSALALVSLVLILSGCAAIGPNHAEMEEELASIPPTKGRIVFYRDKSVVGAAVQPNIFLNGDLVGESKLGGFFYVDLPEGSVEVTSKTEITSTIAFNLREDETLYVRSAITMGLLVGRIQFTLVDPQEARPALTGLNYTGRAYASSGLGHQSRSTRPRNASIGVTLDDLDALLPKKPSP